MAEERKSSRLRVVVKPADAPPAAAAADPATATGIVTTRPESGVCPHCGEALSFEGLAALGDTVCPRCRKHSMVPGRIEGFTLVERIGQGEMGDIFRAVDESLHRDVAVKVVRGRYADDVALRQRLRMEARAAARLSHPAVAQIHALGFSGNHPFLVMELVVGEDFEVRLGRQGTIDERTVLLAALDVSEGLQALHELGLTHGDVKPANIILGKDGRAKLVDFGLSGMARRDESGAILGTPHYIAPELLKGVTDSGQSDIYSLGATLYHLLSGHAPFEGRTPADVAYARLRQTVVRLDRIAPHVSPQTTLIVMRMLEAERGRRYPNCALLGNDLRAALQALDATAAPRGTVFITPSMPSRRETEVAKRNRRLLIGMLSVLALVELGAALFFLGPCRGVGGDVAVALEETTEGVAEVAPPPVVIDPLLSRRLLPDWHDVGLASGRKQGSVVWRQDRLLVQSREDPPADERESGRYVFADVGDAFALVIHLESANLSSAAATCGLLAMENTGGAGPALFFGVTGDNFLIARVRDADGATQVLNGDGRSVNLPLHLRLERRGSRWHAFLSWDGRDWEWVATHEVDTAARGTVGLVLSSPAAQPPSMADFATVALYGAAE